MQKSNIAIKELEPMQEPQAMSPLTILYQCKNHRQHSIRRAGINAKTACIVAFEELESMQEPQAMPPLIFKSMQEEQENKTFKI